MHSIGMEDVWDALPIMLGLSAIMILIVFLAMWWVFKVFKEKDRLDTEHKNNQNIKKGD